MSLSWNLESIENRMEVCWLEGDTGKKQLNPITHALIFATMSVQIGQITDKNADEFYARLSVLEKHWGAFLNNGDGTPYYITPEDVHRHIGLVCNVGNVPRTKWLTWFKSVITDELNRHQRDYGNTLKTLNV